MGSKITTDGDSAKDVIARIRKVSQTFAMLKSIWKSKQLNPGMHVTTRQLVADNLSQTRLCWGGHTLHDAIRIGERSMHAFLVVVAGPSANNNLPRSAVRPKITKIKVRYKYVL